MTIKTPSPEERAQVIRPFLRKDGDDLLITGGRFKELEDAIAAEIRAAEMTAEAVWAKKAQEHGDIAAAVEYERKCCEELHNSEMERVRRRNERALKAAVEAEQARLLTIIRDAYECAIGSPDGPAKEVALGVTSLLLVNAENAIRASKETPNG